MLEGIKTIVFDLGGTLKIEGIGDWIWHHDYLELKRLSQKYKIVIACNQPHKARKFIENSSIGDSVSAIYISWEIHLHKPNTKFFKYFLDDLKINPAETAYVGNDFINDVLPAKKMGIRTIFVKRPIKLIFLKNIIGKLIGIKPDYVVSSIRDIK
ncbi:MAG: HAD family hydrolase [bacterium]